MKGVLRLSRPLLAENNESAAVKKFKERSVKKTISQKDYFSAAAAAEAIAKLAQILGLKGRFYLNSNCSKCMAFLTKSKCLKKCCGQFLKVPGLHCITLSNI